MDVDLLVHEAWPAWEQHALGGWILRYAGGVTKRANSVLALGDPATSLAASPDNPAMSLVSGSLRVSPEGSVTSLAPGSLRASPEGSATSLVSGALRASRDGSVTSLVPAPLRTSPDGLGADGSPGSYVPIGADGAVRSDAAAGSDGSAESDASAGCVTAFGSAVLAGSGGSAGATGRLGLAAEVEPRSPEAPDGLEAAIRAAEAFYLERAAPCVFSIGAGAPPGLDRALEERGYTLVDPTVIMAGMVKGDPAVPVRVEKRPWQEWLEAWWAVDGRYANGVEAAERIVTGVPALYAAVEEGGVPVAVGRGVPQGDRLGIYCMATRPEARRRGLARTVLRALAAESGLRNTYLVVTERNTAAQALYRTEGLEPAGGYHYRIRNDLHPRTLTS